MHTIFLDGRDYDTARDLHEALRRLLALPDYYGCNADALYDCLKGRRETVRLIVVCPGNDEVADTLRKCAAVIGDLGGEVSGL